jgi:hypothetical protein
LRKEKSRRKEKKKIKMKKKIVGKEKLSRIVLKRVVVGHFAMWAVRLSPYLLPAGLEKGIEELDEQLHSNIRAGDEQLIETTYADLRENIRNAISNSKTIASWNVAKMGTGPVFVSAYSHPEPDHDYIDLDAMARNIAQSVWSELFCDDRGFHV